MKTRIIGLLIVLTPAIAFAAETQERSLGMQLFIAAFPILLIIGVVVLITRHTKNVNQGILDSNFEIAKQLKRIADKLDNS